MTVDEYIAALPGELAAVAHAVREIVDAELEGSVCSIKWAQPVWSVGKEPVCYLKKATRHVTFGFWKGASLDDPSGRLESSGSVMAHTKLRTLDDVDPEVLSGWLRQARALVG